ncbi:DEAD/DEAH box helicase [Nocardiopsis alborubida]|uniref:DEAD/DEAH box helicase family protein n=1 Tax=Nocardiopsis alborubida TaxID=146802 RepID=A0A7X6RNF8_9ACTN|nr:DEAD/DEAH box helicase [Nocardiopsis alborubida]NKY96760.1 DEAD/DEAH box helicase family protein [Nocardiopsis alborubida]
MTTPTHPIAVGVAVAAHVSGTWTWSVHTNTARWRGTHPDARQVSDLAPHILDQIHDRFGEQVCVVCPPELGLALPTGREETLRRAAEHARRAARDLTTGHLRTLAIRRLPAEHHLLPGQEWTVSVHAVVDDDGSDWVWVTGGGWYATGQSTSPDLTQVAFEAIDAAATASPLGGRVRVECDEPVAVKRAQSLAEALRQVQPSSTTGVVPDQVDITHVETGSTPHHRAAVTVCSDLPDEDERRAPGALYPYQERGISALVTLWDTHDRGQLHWACGTGKTVAYAESARRIGARRTLVLVPSLDLVPQIAQEWIARAGAHLRLVVGVCSERETLSAAADEPLARMQHLHATVVQDASALAALAALISPVLVVGTYQSLGVLVHAHADHGLDPWDVVFADEAHHTAGGWDNTWSVVHDNTRLPARLRCYGTATPRIVVDRTGNGVASMDDEQVFGPIAHTMTFGAAISVGTLADYQLIGALVHADQVARAITHRSRIAVDGHQLPADLVAAQIALLRSVRTHDLRSLICFAPNLAWARVFTDTLQATADLLGPDGPERPVSALHIHGYSTGQQRQHAKDALARPGRGVSVVTVVGCFVEGVDVPAVDAVGLFSSNQVRGRLIQSIGRALRTGGRKNKVAKLIAPLYVPADSTPEEVLEHSRHAAFVRIVHGLSSVDERFAHALTTQQTTSRGPGRALPSDLERWVHITDTGTGLAADFIEQVTTVVLGEGTSHWWHNYRIAEEWYKAHGHLNVDASITTTSGRFTLRQWLVRQRSLHARNLLPSRYVDALSRIGMDFTPQTGGPFWPRAQTAITQWLTTHDDLVPSPTDALYAQLRHLRNLYKKGKLTPDQIAWLDEHHMIWDMFHYRRTRSIHELGRFIIGNNRFPDRTHPEEKRLFFYHRSLRMLHHRGQLHPEHQRLCHDLRIPLSRDDVHALPPPPLGPRTFTLHARTAQEVIRAINEGASQEEIARAADRTVEFISVLLRESGQPTFSVLRQQAILTRIHNGESYLSIARRFQIPELSVGNVGSRSALVVGTGRSTGAWL